MRSTGISRRLVAGSRYNASVASRAASVNLSERTARARGSLRQASRSEEHTSELQSQSNLVCRLLLEKKKTSSGRRGVLPPPPPFSAPAPPSARPASPLWSTACHADDNPPASLLSGAEHSVPPTIPP